MEGADNLIRILVTLQNRADSQNVPAEYSWDAISNMLKNVSGIKMDYETFKKQYDSIPQMQNIVDRFDSNGLVLKTQEEPEVTKSGDRTSSLDTSAKRAAKKALQQPG